MIRAFLALLLAIAWLAPAQADELRPASLSLTQNDGGSWTLAWKQPVTRPDEALVVPEIPANCRFAGDIARRLAVNALLGTVQLQCEGPVAGGTIGAPDLVISGDALVRIKPLDKPVQAYRLTAAEPVAAIVSEPSTWQVWRSYFGLGVEHILEGWDHLLFVIALVLLVSGSWAVVKAATAFTIAHSITLAAVTFGYAGLPSRPVEALIALSIVFLAVEVARGTPDTLTRRLPWLVAFAFGLFHGFGFAGALREIGLPQGEVPAALISFNLGVEAGQLLVIAMVIAIRALIQRFAAATEPAAIKLAAYAIGITGSYWLIERLVS
ncbi:HupE/UreJ family protein [Qipengyuania sp. DGS5-3]|uniref:HupE/UreJ family protein n=1 Tax=Qipengyuania sp. DGS5-3 TaxID=3349632 RepID=UPI0036D31D75